jgi:hypothetical protein
MRIFTIATMGLVSAIILLMLKYWSLRKQYAILRKTKNDLKHLMKYLVDKYGIDDKRVETLVDRYNPSVMYPSTSSYTINKGSVIAIDVYDNDGKPHDNNTLVYVCIHELAHIITPSVNDHTDTIFKTNLNWLVGCGVDCGILHRGTASYNNKEFTI